MTAPAELREFVAAYLVEAEEHLANANSQLLAIEAAQRRGEANPRAVRETFRSLHTIKGLSAMVGVEQIVAIAHRLESFLREFDRTSAPLPSQAIDGLLRGVRAIEQRVAGLGRGELAAEPSDELLAELDSLGLAGRTPVASASERSLDLEPALYGKLAPFEIDQIFRGIALGKRALRAEFIPSPARVAEGLSINSVRERLTTIAEIVRVLPQALPVSAAAPGGLSFVLIVLTSASDEVLVERVGSALGGLRNIAGGLSAPAPADTAPTSELPLDLAPDDPFDVQTRRGVVRVDVSRLDDAMEGLSALIVTRFRLARAVAALGERGVNTRELSAIMTDNARQLRDLRAAIVRVRMVPVSELLERVPLLVRGLRRSANRAVRLELEGGTAELDKSVCERLFPVIVHLVRNAVDHAIETPDERLRRGKTEEGLLRITCSARSNTRLELTVSDDGRGIDRTAVARKAGRPGPSDDAALLDLLCIPGLSTRDVATTTSGRGMGMEIVKRTIVDELGGELAVTSELGKGTTFTLQVPLTISIVDAFSFECAAQRFVVPVSMVDEIIEVDPLGLAPLPAGDDGSPRVDIISRRGMALPMIQLAQVFRLQKTQPTPSKAIIVRRAGAPLAFAVDRMLGQQEVVIRPVNDVLIRAPGISGATDLGDGRPTLVLDLIALSVSLSALPKSHGARS